MYHMNGDGIQLYCYFDVTSFKDILGLISDCISDIKSGNVKIKVLVDSLISTLQACPAESLPPGTMLPQGRIHHTSMQPWIRAPGTHYCWVDRGNVG